MTSIGISCIAATKEGGKTAAKSVTFQSPLRKKSETKPSGGGAASKKREEEESHQTADP